MVEALLKGSVDEMTADSAEAYFEFDGSTIPQDGITVQSTGQFTLKKEVLKSGYHSLKAFAVDDFGNSDEGKNITFTLPDGAKIYLVEEGAEVYEYNITKPFDLDGATHYQTYSEPSNKEGGAQSISWNDDGTKMYLLGTSQLKIYEYVFSKNYDISTGSFNQSLDIGSNASNPEGMAWKNDGTKVYYCDNNLDKVFQYSLNTAFDISTANYEKEYDIGGESLYSSGLSFNDDGTKMYITDEVDGELYSYNLSTAFDISTASYNQTLDVSTEQSAPMGMYWKNDGSKMFIIFDSNQFVYEYELSTFFDISTASSVGSYDISSKITTPKGIIFK